MLVLEYKVKANPSPQRGEGKCINFFLFPLPVWERVSKKATINRGASDDIKIKFPLLCWERAG
ncbi:MAG: hypothetical protein CV045_03865 [Cyanobacteria bacterium M5B4]|nr:MAG: hypothetical protein CV045_03865 [Cyanobacteria bacterium M5B4]